MSTVTLYIQERSGDFNFDEDFEDIFEAQRQFVNMKDTLNGYYVDTEEGVRVFVPWHRVDHVEFIENEE